MKQLNPTTLLLTKQEAYTLLCPQADGCSDYLLDEGIEITCLGKYLERGSVDWQDIQDEIPQEYHSFQMNFDHEDTLKEQLPYIEGHLKQYGIIKPEGKKLRTRLGDIRQECLEYLRDCGMASNKYGLPRPGMLDLTFCNVWIKAPRGYEAHYDYDYRVIAVIQPINQLLIRKYKVLHELNKHGERNEATGDYRLVDINDLDIYDLTDLVDDIKHQTLNFRPVWQTGFSTEINQFLDILKENRRFFDVKKGDEVCIQSWLYQGGDEYKRAKPYITTIIDINDNRVIYTDNDGAQCCDVLYNLVPADTPFSSYFGCEKCYEWQEEEEEEKYK